VLPSLLPVLSLVSASFPFWPQHTEVFSQIAKTKLLSDLNELSRPHQAEVGHDQTFDVEA
jgi:hypothetical protein